jgi:hypothetical protein
MNKRLLLQYLDYQISGVATAYPTEIQAIAAPSWAFEMETE